MLVAELCQKNHDFSRLTLPDRYFILAIEDAMTYRMWRLSEAGPRNLGLACTDDGLLFGRTPLIERRNGRFAVRERDEIERLLQHGHRYIGEADRSPDARFGGRGTSTERR